VCYRHADTSRPIPFNSPRRADSNMTLLDSGCHPPGEVCHFFFQLTSIAMRTLPNLHHSIPLNRRIPMHPVQMLSDRWLKDYPYLSTLVSRASTFQLFATECYWHVDTSRPIPFKCTRRVDSIETLSDSDGPLPGDLSPFFFLLTSIAMRTLRNLYHSIPLTKLNPTHALPTLSHHWLKGYPYLCTLVLWATTFKLVATECYSFLD